MDHPRGGKRLHFDEPLTGYPSHRQKRSQPTPRQASSSNAPTALLLPPLSITPTFPAAPPALTNARHRTLTAASASSRLPQHTDSSPIVPTQLIEDHRRR